MEHYDSLAKILLFPCLLILTTHKVLTRAPLSTKWNGKEEEEEEGKEGMNGGLNSNAITVFRNASVSGTIDKKQPN